MTDTATATGQEPGGELVVAPEEGEDAQLDAAVAHINHIYTVKGLETARTIGEYLLEHFFDGDLEAVHDRHTKDHSFRKLAAREDLYPSAPFLYQSVALIGQLRQLPADVAEALPFSHHRLLLPVKDRDEKRRLASRAVDEGMSWRQLNTVVEQVLHDQPKKSGGGRPRLPTLIKGLRKLDRIVEEVHSAPVPREHLQNLETQDRQRLLSCLDEQILTLSAIRDVLGKCVESERRS